ncbi:MAG TPA: tetratricopeptide repeat protein [Polyangiales bacterium]|nr:tetratricopeptide repeat protein [Polyangiales bacterium]
MRWVLGTMLLATLATAAAPRAVQAQDAAGAGPAISPEDEEKARAHFRLGRAHYDNGNFAQAAAEFEEAYRISQRSQLLYNIYLAYRDANDTRHAAESLRKYLELQKEVENRGQLEARLAALERSLADGTAPQPAAQPQGPQPQAPPAEAQPAQPAAQPEATPAPVAATETAPPPEKATNIVPWVLMGTGGAMIITSLVTGSIASSKQSDLDKKCPDKNNCTFKTAAEEKQLKDLQSSGKSMALITDILMFGGIAVAGTGAVLFILDRAKGDSASSESSNAPTASVACLPGACAGSVTMKF